MHDHPTLLRGVEKRRHAKHISRAAAQDWAPSRSSSIPPPESYPTNVALPKTPDIVLEHPRRRSEREKRRYARVVLESRTRFCVSRSNVLGTSTNREETRSGWLGCTICGPNANDNGEDHQIVD